MGRYPFSYSAVVTDGECGPDLCLRPAGILRYMQQAATMHLESMGLPYDRLYREGFVFVLVSQALCIERPPKSRETLQIATCPAKRQGAHLLRETVIFGADGKRIAEGQSSWAMLNPDSNRVLRTTEFPYELPVLGDSWHPFCDPRHLKLPASSGEQAADRIVAYSDIDRNRHMNNTVYADILLDSFGSLMLQNSRVSHLFLRYRTQALLGDIMKLWVGNEGKLRFCRAVIGGKPCFEGAFVLDESGVLPTM
jgi:acyl-ACP thioesterase